MKITIENEVYDITNDTITFGHPTTKEHFVKMIKRACDMFLDYQLTSARGGVMKLYEVDFEDGSSMVIRSYHKPSIEEANKWLAADIELMKCGAVTNVTDEIDEEEARMFYDFSIEKDWPIFGKEVE